jgi:hypothetical protein
MSFPALCRRRHSASVKALVRKMEVTLVLVAEERRNRFQDSCAGSGNRELYNVRKLWLDGHCHLALLPNEQDGTSVMAFQCPAMCRVVSGEARAM